MEGAAVFVLVPLLRGKEEEEEREEEEEGGGGKGEAGGGGGGGAFNAHGVFVPLAEHTRLFTLQLSSSSSSSSSSPQALRLTEDGYTTTIRLPHSLMAAAAGPSTHPPTHPPTHSIKHPYPPILLPLPTHPPTHPPHHYPLASFSYGRRPQVRPPPSFLLRLPPTHPPTHPPTYLSTVVCLHAYTPLHLSSPPLPTHPPTPSSGTDGGMDSLLSSLPTPLSMEKLLLKETYELTFTEPSLGLRVVGGWVVCGCLLLRFPVHSFSISRLSFIHSFDLPTHLPHPNRTMPPCL